MSARLRRPADVAAVELDGVVYVARVPDGPITVLRGSAGLIWLEAHEGDRPGIVERVALLVGADPEAIRADVDGFVQLLLGQGLLSEEGGAPPPQRPSVIATIAATARSISSNTRSLTS